MAEPVRLLIWDLDETFWKGTLTEGGISEYSQKNHNAVVELARRGIMSSICSKNDFLSVKAIFEEKGIWEYFVFPSIDWTPKGSRIANIIEEMGLRPASVMFVDDNPSNLAEVSSIIKDIQVQSQHYLDGILENPLFNGKDDSTLSRLGQYKLLEQKSIEKGRFKNDAKAFLSESNIKVEIDYDINIHVDRIIELVNRTNQLNFTKARYSDDPEVARAEFFSQLNSSPFMQAGVVKVSDKYGDYGVIGFWMKREVGMLPKLVHFAFSCRTLGMGIEQWVYEKLGRPELHIVGEVVSALDFVPDWINVSSNAQNGRETSALKDATIYLRGSCELEVLKHFFSFDSKKVDADFNFGRRAWSVWLNHILSFFKNDQFLVDGALQKEIERFGFEATDFGLKPEALSGVDLRVFSLSADAYVFIYRSREYGIDVPFFRWGMIPFQWEVEAGIEKFIVAHDYERYRTEIYDAYEAIRNEYDVLEFDINYFKQLYAKLIDDLPIDSLTIFLLPLDYHPAGEDRRAIKEQTLLNSLMAELCAGKDHVEIIYVSNIITSNTQLLENSRFHFTKEANFQIYKEVVTLYERWNAIKAKNGGSTLST